MVSPSVPSVAKLKAIPVVLKQLGALATENRHVLSVTLDTAPDRVVGHAWLQAFRSGCKRMRTELPEAESGAFERAVRQVERYLAHSADLPSPGLALYATGDEHDLLATALPRSPADQVTWAAEPRIEPLIEALDDFQRIAIVLLDKERTRVYTVLFDRIEVRQEFHDEVPGKQATGGWFGLEQTSYARRHEEHVLRHVRRTSTALMAVLGAAPFDRLFIAGPPEAVSLLRHHLPRPLRLRFTGELGLELFASDNDVLAAVREASMNAERVAEQRAVEELLQSGSTDGTAIGAIDVLDALNDRRVHRLFVSAGLPLPGGVCRSCGRLTAEGRTCQVCGTSPEQMDDMTEPILTLARQQGAAIDLVSGEATSLLASHDGIAAWTWY